MLQGNETAYNDELYNMMCAHTGDGKYYLEYLWLSIEGRYDIIMDNAEPEYPGVILEMDKSEAIWDIAVFVKKKLITIEDLDGFSQELIDSVKEILER